MSLRVAYAYGLTLAMTAAMLGVLLGGELPVIAWLALLAPLVAAYRLLRQVAPPLGLVRLVTVFTVIVIGWGVLYVMRRGAEGLLVAAATALLGMLAGRLLTRDSLRHDLQALLVSLLLVFAGAGLHVQMSYGAVFVLYAITATWALVLRQLWAGAELEAEHEGGAPAAVTLGRRDVVTPAFFAMTGGVALAILLITSIIFVAFPRVGFGALGLARRNQGRLPDGVVLDGTPRAAGAGGSVVARVTGLPYATFARGLYLRAGAYDELGTKGFVRSPGAVREREPLAAGEAALRYTVFLQPVVERQLPTLGPFESIEHVGGGSDNVISPLRLVFEADAGLVLTNQPLRTPVRYRVAGHGMRRAEDVGTPLPAAEVPPTVAALTRLPAGMDERIVELAQDLGAEGDVIDKVKRVRAYLADGFTYTLDPPPAAGEDPLGAFLFRHKSGHCEYFAAAFAMLLRAMDVPARVVGGFAGGAWDDVGGVVVFSESNAHAWIEWYAPGLGWVLDDATPLSNAPPARLSGLAAWTERLARAWDEYVLDYDLARQVGLVQAAMEQLPRGPRLPSADRMRQLGAFAAPFVVLGLVALLWRRRHLGWRWSRRPRLDPLAEALLAACARLGGAPPEEAVSLRAAVRRVARHVDADGRVVLESALQRYERARFGGEALSGAALARLVRQVHEVRGQGSVSVSS